MYYKDNYSINIKSKYLMEYIINIDMIDYYLEECINKKYISEKRIGWYINTQFIVDEIQPLVESNGNLHTQNCQIIQLNNKRVYRGMITEQELLGKYIFDVNDNFPPVQK